MRIVVTGATGFIGSAAAFRLARSGHQLVLVSRDPERLRGLPGEPAPLPTDAPGWARLLQGAHAVVHLAGESIGEGRWTTDRKRRLRESRIGLTERISAGIAELPAESRPGVFVAASGAGYYGEGGERELTEFALAGKGFLAELARDWEDASRGLDPLGVRRVHLRLGLVLDGAEGALPGIPPLCLGSGRQFLSWIHLEDALGLLEFALEQPALSGPLNATAPEAVRYRDFARELAQARGWPALLASPALAAPEWVLRLALGEMAGSLLQSSRVLPARARAAGFRFRYPDLRSALQAIYPAEHRGSREFSARQFAPRPLTDVFPFFSRAENLEEITPPWLSFRILRKSTPEIRENTCIDYRLKIHGMPVRWRSRIERWLPGREFVDTQLRGPYSKWHHTHRFEELRGGTLIEDRVFYRVPGGLLGELLLGRKIRSDIRAIFGYRKRAVGEVFGG